MMGPSLVCFVFTPLLGLDGTGDRVDCPSTGRRIKLLIYEESGWGSNDDQPRRGIEGLYVLLGGLALLAGLVLLGFDLILGTREGSAKIPDSHNGRIPDSQGGRIPDAHAPRVPDPQRPRARESYTLGNTESWSGRVPEATSTPRFNGERIHFNTPASSVTPELTPREYWL